MDAEQRAALAIIIGIAVDAINNSDYGEDTTEAEERAALATCQKMLATPVAA